MFSLLNIIKKNRDTFYDFNTGIKKNTKRHNAAKITAAIIITALFPNIDKDIITSVTAIYAILIGFSFNSLFHLTTENRGTKKQSTNTGSIEEELRNKKTKNLSQEIFFNTLYFNIVSVSLLVASLSFFLPEAVTNNETITLIYKAIELKITEHSNININIAFKYIYSSIIYILLIESLYTFIRLSLRISYYFERSLK